MWSFSSFLPLLYPTSEICCLLYPTSETCRLLHPTSEICGQGNLLHLCMFACLCPYNCLYNLCDLGQVLSGVQVMLEVQAATLWVHVQ